MSLKPLNSVGGFSVGTSTITTVIYPNTDITTANLIVSNFANLGNVGNIYIGGGNSGAVLSTDGLGNLNWSSSPGVTEIQNGNSNVSIPTSNGNIYINANNGTDYQWVYDTTGNLVLPDSGVLWNNGGLTTLQAGSDGAQIGSNDGQSYVIANANGTYMQTLADTSNYTWHFDTTGNSTFPAVGTANLGNYVVANFASFANDLSATGNITATGNVTASNFSTTGSAGNITGANVIFANSFTSNGGTVDFNTNNANVLLGNIANVHIYGGSNGQALITDGTGNLSWTSTANVSEIYNGNSNVTIPTTDGNVYINANSGSDQQWVFDTNGYLTLPVNGVITSLSAIDIYTSNNSSYSEIYLTDGPGGTVTIATNAETQNWTFDQNGIITLANGSSITGQPNTAINFYTNSSVYSGITLNDDGTNSNVLLYSMDGTYNWTFDQTGNATFPSIGTANLGNLVVANNITSGSGNVDFNTNNANVLLGSNTNVHIYGGSAGQVLQTDGAGNLNWYAISATEIVNGNSNVTIPTANDNVYIYTNGTNEWIFDTTGNTTFPGIGTANLGNLVTANYANFANDANIQGNLEVVGNIQTGGGSGGNISGVDYLFANYANLTNDLNANGNVNAQGNVLANYINANIDLYVGANANIVGTAKIYQEQLTSVSSTQIIYANGSSYLVGNAAFTYDESSSNVSIGGNANVTGNVVTNAKFIGNTLTSTGTYLTLQSDSVGNGTYNINLVPGGAGNVDVHSTYITSLADPVNPQDAATKQYVDNISQGLYVHQAANLLSYSNLNATYNNGGTSLTVTDIIGNNVVQFSGAHGLSVGNTISFTNSFNGISGDPDIYYVASVPASNQITLKDEYYGPSPVETLTAGSGLSQPALGQAGLGATLTNAGTNAALVIDSITATVSERVLVTGQTNQAYNGIYDVTTVGDGSTAWVLTRSSDGSSYIPQSANGLSAGSYFFITNGDVYGGSSWIVTTTGEIDIGITNVVFVQFSQGGAYTGSNGINVTGTLITANVDNETTAIIGGNIAVKTSANLVTPNIGDATFSSLTWNNSSNGNINVSNINASNTILTNVLSVNTSATANTLTTNAWANIGTDLIVGGNANISGNVQVGNGSGGNITGVNYIYANTANITLDAIIGGNANISGNLTAGNSFLNETHISGNANVTGNTLANYITSNVDITAIGNINANIANITNDALIGGNANVSSTLFVGNNSSNVTITNGNANLTGNIFIGNNSSNVSITNDGNITVSKDANIANSIVLGNTAINWATVTTSATAANQTIAQVPASSVTGVEFFVKGLDNNGVFNKYSAATVMAVTDGSGNADFVIYGTTFIGASTGTLAVNIVGSNVALQVTPSSSNSTVWTTQFRTI
jgi:autotransporter family porin